MSGAFINRFFGDPAKRHCAEPIEFSTFGREILDSETLTDLVYRAFLTLMAKRYQSSPYGCYEGFNWDLVALLQQGLYLPCVERVTYTRLVDQRNDGLPEHAAVFLLHPDEDIEIYQVRRLQRFPCGIAGLAAGIPFKAICWHREVKGNRRERRFYDGVDDVLVAYDSYLTITSDDRVVHSLSTRCRWQRNPLWNCVTTVWPALVFNAWADRKSLWQVRTLDHVINAVPTPLTLGVAEDYVKSLFYARSLPLTETGRKRPILHWVRAHQRRLAEGLDIDVRKHLRGITAFEMDSLSFEIISPDKEAERVRAEAAA
jgi:hypothetical protein